MPKYFLHHRSSHGIVLDEEGEDFPDLEAAREEATQAARELMSEDVLKGIAPDGSQFKIADEHGRIVAVTTFASTLQHN